MLRRLTLGQLSLPKLQRRNLGVPVCAGVLFLFGCLGATADDPELVVEAQDQKLVIDAPGANSIADARDPNISLCFEPHPNNAADSTADFNQSRADYWNFIQQAYQGTALNLTNGGVCAASPATDTKIVIDERNTSGAAAVRYCTLAESTVGTCSSAAGNVPVAFVPGQKVSRNRAAQVALHEMMHVLGFGDEFAGGCVPNSPPAGREIVAAETTGIIGSTGYCNGVTALSDRDKLGLEIVYGAPVRIDGIRGVGLAWGTGRVFHTQSELTLEWLTRGATSNAFATTPNWALFSDSPASGTGNSFTPISEGALFVSFNDYGNQSRVSDLALIDDSVFTSVVMAVL